jgi:hypothetical protein
VKDPGEWHKVQLSVFLPEGNKIKSTFKIDLANPGKGWPFNGIDPNGPEAKLAEAMAAYGFTYIDDVVITK